MYCCKNTFIYKIQVDVVIMIVECIDAIFSDCNDKWMSEMDYSYINRKFFYSELQRFIHKFVAII
jgi:hypothetical protein